MLSSTTQSFTQIPHKFSGESFLPPTSATNIRQSTVTFISAAYSSATAGECGRATATATRAKPAAPSSFYEVLGIPIGASNNEIKAAYRRLARLCHPDVAAIDDKSSSADQFMKVHTAYSTLSDPEKRADYDRGLFRNHRGSRLYSRPSPTMSSYSGYVSRNWETDQCW